MRSARPRSGSAFESRRPAASRRHTGHSGGQLDALDISDHATRCAPSPIWPSTRCHRYDAASGTGPREEGWDGSEEAFTHGRPQVLIAGGPTNVSTPAPPVRTRTRTGYGAAGAGGARGRWSRNCKFGAWLQTMVEIAGVGSPCAVLVIRQTEKFQKGARCSESSMTRPCVCPPSREPHTPSA